MYVCVGFLTATVQEEAGNDHAVCQITSERFQKSLQRHLSMYVSFHHDAFKYNTSHLIPSVTYFISSLPFVLLLGEQTLFFPLSSLILPLAMRAVLPPFVVSLSPSADDATRVILKSTDDYINANYINVSWLLPCSLFHLSVNISVPRLRPGGWSAVRTLKTHAETLRWPQW